MKEGNILVVDDEIVMCKYLNDLLEGEGYKVTAISDPREALNIIRKEPQDLVLTDLNMPYLDGLELCRRIKSDLLFKHIPVIILTVKSEIMDKIKGIYVGADDYVVKPFEPAELLARIKMSLRRSRQDLDANPLTKLPGNVSIYRAMEDRIKSGQIFSVCYLDLDKFKEFNDRYGFSRGDEVIKELAGILIKVVQQLGNADDFIGHIGGDDFALITTPARVDAICQQIIRMFDAQAPLFYDEEDRKRGFITCKDRQGNVQQVSILSVSIGVVSNEKRQIEHIGMIGQIGADLKAYAKTFSGSIFVKDRREE